MTSLPASHPPMPAPRVGVLLVNLGTPEAAEAGAVRRYLKQFLSDKRVVELPSILWQPILRGAVLRTRPRKSARAYAQVWTPEGSPLLAFTRRQAFALDARLGDGITVAFAMRYGRPAIDEVLSAMQAKGCDRILVAPLYPQYCAATTATANDAAFAALAAMRWQPALRTLPPYHDDPAYIDALAGEIEQAVGALDFKPRAILASFHGMPQRTLEKGDPYHCHCQKTARLLGERLSIPLTISFQSRFGRAKWLEPATDTMLAKLAKEGINDIAVVAPGFSADCLETLEELAIRGREQFLEAGGRNFAYLPCLNDAERGLDMLETIIRRELAGWIA
ncbi:ferrochelatase [Sphingorhabdus soli]|uniref:Ferrochelatase n=1 Tax=Flavisphingopyxis soli TaxID=2601267 RepID=A0A5C6ULC3_9SPHN|nr:ferrochelatase [Sphingorhabdus soli]TXC73254.1 ferrochelatase [Sphingorhabdus soli]